MKTIRTRVSDEDYAEYKAADRNWRVAQRALRRLKRRVKHGSRLYNLKVGGAVIATADVFSPFEAYRDGVLVRVGLTVRGVDAESDAHLWEILEVAYEAGEDPNDAIYAALPSTVYRDVAALLDWASPRGTALWRGPVEFFREPVNLPPGRGLGAAPLTSNNDKNN